MGQREASSRSSGSAKNTKQKIGRLEARRERLGKYKTFALQRLASYLFVFSFTLLLFPFPVKAL